MDEEWAAFEQYDFKKWGFTAFKTFNDYAIIIANNSDKIRTSCGFVVSTVYF